MKWPTLLWAIVLLLIIGFILLNLLTKKSYFIKLEDIRRICCAECLNAFSQSPVGVGPSAARCDEFTSAAPISENCQDYYQRNPWTVQQCQKLMGLGADSNWRR